MEASMLYQFLAENREKILALTTKKTDKVSQDKPTTAKSERGLPQFYDHLTGELERESKGLPKFSTKWRAFKYKRRKYNGRESVFTRSRPSTNGGVPFGADRGTKLVIKRTISPSYRPISLPDTVRHLGRVGAQPAPAPWDGPEATRRVPARPSLYGRSL